MHTKEQFAKTLDTTFLKPDATNASVVRFCKEARKYHFATAIVFPSHLRIASDALRESDVKPGTVVGFPYGANGRASKIYEARTAIANGARELDMVINISALKSGEHKIVEREIIELVSAVRSHEPKPTTLKFIIECCYLTEEEKRTACMIIRDAGADFIMTSSGVGPGGANAEDIRIIRQVVGPGMGVKAAGGIQTTDHAMEMLNAGANRIGASGAAGILDHYNPEDYAEGAGKSR